MDGCNDGVVYDQIMTVLLRGHRHASASKLFLDEPEVIFRNVRANFISYHGIRKNKSFEFILIIILIILSSLRIY